MTSFDVIVTWPNNCDYPLWREFVRANRHRFEDVIIVFMETNQGHSYKEFVKKAMAADGCIFLDEPTRPAAEDWRNNCVNFGLKYSKSDWVWFTEQDFFPQNNFWQRLDEITKTSLWGGVMVADRLHPCCLVVHKDVLENTHKDFSARPAEGYDHFGRFQSDIERLNVTHGYWGEEDWIHYNGLSQNFNLMSQGLQPNYHEREFADYLCKCLDVSVDLDQHFVIIVREYLKTLAPEM